MVDLVAQGIASKISELCGKTSDAVIKETLEEINHRRITQLKKELITHLTQGSDGSNSSQSNDGFDAIPILKPKRNKKTKQSNVGSS